ncbi:hypothetical protein BH24PSE2_BH24PSE2_09050 [soil metagenome]
MDDRKPPLNLAPYVGLSLSIRFVDAEAALRWCERHHRPLAALPLSLANLNISRATVPMECLLQALDELEDILYTVPMLWSSVRAPVLVGLTATLAAFLV